MRNLGLFVLQTFYLWLFYAGGNLIASVIPFPIPGNVVGMVLLFVALCLGIVKVEQLSVASSFLLKHLTFFFIPLAVGLMNWGELFMEHSVTIGISIVASALLTLLGVAALTLLCKGRVS
ncbi:MAG: CidA/LrgA family protein [Selenomonadales bacterium]|nr:CidA/LrgA family protein [Selenomonadales bacterium]